MKNILLIVLCFFLASCDENAETKEERSKSIAESKELFRKCRENPYAYFKIDEVVLKLPTNSKIYASYEREPAYHKCQTSAYNPLQIDRLKLNFPLELQDAPKRFIANVTLNSKQTALSKIQGIYESASSDVRQQGKSFDDLEIVNGFYKHVKPTVNPHSPESSRTQYFAVSDVSDASTNIPLMLSLCGPTFQGIGCRASFMWKPGIYVNAGIHHMQTSDETDADYQQKLQKIDSLETWLILRQLIIEQLEERTFDLDEQHKLGDKN